MLYVYPAEATKENWVHTCLCLMMRTIHKCVKHGSTVPTWPAIIPASLQNKLETRTGLGNRIQCYATELAKLSQNDQQTAYRAILEQNRIGRLLQGQCNCSINSTLPSGIRKAIADLTTEAFRLLSEFGVRDRQYTIVYQAQEHSVCPFCGLDHFRSPGGPREDLDHYLPRSKYAFAGANLRNLAPMCDTCNTDYKKDQDPLWNGTLRRTALNPYGDTEVAVSLINSVPFGGSKPYHPEWRIDFQPNSPEVSTWNDVFKIRYRYENDILDKYYMSWLKQFGDSCARLDLQPTDKNELLSATQLYRDLKALEGLSNWAFLKTAVFDMLIHHCQQDNQPLIAWLLRVAN